MKQEKNDEPISTMKRNPMKKRHASAKKVLLRLTAGASRNVKRRRVHRPNAAVEGVAPAQQAKMQEKKETMSRMSTPWLIRRF
jgi:hypothetical protein